MVNNFGVFTADIYVPLSKVINQVFILLMSLRSNIYLSTFPIICFALLSIFFLMLRILMTFKRLSDKKPIKGTITLSCFSNVLLCNLFNWRLVAWNSEYWMNCIFSSARWIYQHSGSQESLSTLWESRR